jgi:hypothetical protein
VPSAKSSESRCIAPADPLQREKAVIISTNRRELKDVIAFVDKALEDARTLNGVRRDDLIANVAGGFGVEADLVP